MLGEQADETTKKSAENVSIKAMERIHDRKKCERLSGDDETPQKIPRYSGNSTIT